jgi:hypothetical protein
MSHKKIYLLYLVFARRFAQYESIMSIHTMLIALIRKICHLPQRSFNVTNKGVKSAGLEF